jgi:hypothetical protein
MHYRALIVEEGTRIPAQARPALEMLCRTGRVIAWGDAEDSLEGAVVAKTPEELVAAIDALCPVDLSITPQAEDVRYRHVTVDEEHWYILCNEGMAPVSVDVHVAAQGVASWVDPWRDEGAPVEGTPAVTMAPYTTMILRVTPP